MDIRLTNKPLIVPGLQEQRRLQVGKSIDGSWYFEGEGAGRFTFSPEVAFQIATGILRGLGITFEIAGRPPNGT